jgi:hypothetical protein
LICFFKLLIGEKLLSIRRSFRFQSDLEAEASPCPSESSAPLLAARRYRLTASSSGIGYPPRVSDRVKYRPHCLDDPALPLVLTSAVRFSLTRFRWSLFRCPVGSSLEFRLPLEFYTAAPSQPAAAGQPLSWALFPYSTSRFGGPLVAGLLPCYVPPSGFDYPLGGFLPSNPCWFSFAPAALLGFTLRRFPLIGGIRGVTTRMNPPTVNLAVSPPPKRRAGPIGLGFWASTLP